MLTIKATIQGVVHLAMDKLDPDMILNPPPHPPRPTDEQLQAQADRATYRNDAGLYMPRRAIKKAILDGSSRANIKVGRVALAKYLEATLFVEPREVPFGLTEPDEFEQFVVRRKDGNSIIKRRPLLKPGWELTFELMLDENRDPAQVKVALESAGTLVGLGAGRPEYGRFIVISWKVQNGIKRSKV